MLKQGQFYDDNVIIKHTNSKDPVNSHRLVHAASPRGNRDQHAFYLHENWQVYENLAQLLEKINSRPTRNKAFIDIRAQHHNTSPYGPVRPNFTSSINGKYRMYHNAAGGGPSHGHKGSAQQIS